MTIRSASRTAFRSGCAPAVVRLRISCSSRASAVLNDQLVEESVQLRFGQRIGSFLFQRVLRGHHEERAWRACGFHPPLVTCFSCIASSIADCVLGGARLISSASTIWAKIGPSRNLN